MADDKFNPRVSDQEETWNADSYAAVYEAVFRHFLGREAG